MLRVLYVDDEADIREIASIALSLDQDIMVETASSGREAITRIGRGGIDLLLLDVMMPDMDGPATLAQLRSDPATHDLKVIFATARTQRHEIEHYLSLGALGVVRKPFDPMTLAQDVRALAARGAAA
jgi:CheY-like chemotaxis protein